MNISNFELLLTSNDTDSDSDSNSACLPPVNRKSGLDTDGKSLRAMFIYVGSVGAKAQSHLIR